MKAQLETLSDQLRAATAEIMKLRSELLERVVSDQKRKRPSLDDSDFQGHSYNTGIDEEAKQLRLAIYKRGENSQLLGYIILSAEESYQLGSKVLRLYDKLEGIDESPPIRAKKTK